MRGCVIPPPCGEGRPNDGRCAASSGSGGRGGGCPKHGFRCGYPHPSRASLRSRRATLPARGRDRPAAALRSTCDSPGHRPDALEPDAPCGPSQDQSRRSLAIGLAPGPRRLVLQLLQGVGHHPAEHRAQHRGRDQACAAAFLARAAGRPRFVLQKIFVMGHKRPSK